MRMVDIIEEKVEGKALSDEEIRFFIDGYTKGSIPDYQASAWAMAVLFQGMTPHEIATLTDAMEHSGETMDLSAIKGIKVDKHSTGGVGDKTSLALGPLVAACGAKLAKMSGRGLGHTGGTLDKMESVPGTNVFLTPEQFIDQVNRIGIAIVGQTAEVDPADKKLYALRDVTGTVQSIPLIASSIMSKKLACGSNTILLDVKFGNGAFMKTIDDARELAKTMVQIGDDLGRDTRAILTDMNEPLGFAVGNALEVQEAVATLHGQGPRDFTELVTQAGAIMLCQAKIATSVEAGRKKIQTAMQDGSGFQKMLELFAAQGGDISYLEHPEKFPKAAYITPILAPRSGYVKAIDSLEIGLSAMRLGAGRATMRDKIDMAAGIVLQKKIGNYVEQGKPLAYAYTNKTGVEEVLTQIQAAFTLDENKVKAGPVVHEMIAL